MKEKKINQARYVYQKNLTNLEIKTLTFSQHEKIQELCEMRHKLHSGDMFSTESSCLSECSRYFFERIKIEGVGFLDVGYEIENLTTEIDLEFEDYQAYEYESIYSKFKSFNYDEIEGINKKIEEFLFDIDKRFGTQYCPTGKSRGNIL